jgi:hypothetical protein
MRVLPLYDSRRTPGNLTSLTWHVAGGAAPNFQPAVSGQGIEASGRKSTKWTVVCFITRPQEESLTSPKRRVHSSSTAIAIDGCTGVVI